MKKNKWGYVDKKSFKRKLTVIKRKETKLLKRINQLEKKSPTIEMLTRKLCVIQDLNQTSKRIEEKVYTLSSRFSRLHGMFLQSDYKMRRWYKRRKDELATARNSRNLNAAFKKQLHNAMSGIRKLAHVKGCIVTAPTRETTQTLRHMFKSGMLQKLKNLYRGSRNPTKTTLVRLSHFEYKKLLKILKQHKGGKNGRNLPTP